MVKNKPPNLEGSISDNLADYTHFIFILLFLEFLVECLAFQKLSNFRFFRKLSQKLRNCVPLAPVPVFLAKWKTPTIGQYKQLQVTIPVQVPFQYWLSKIPLHLIRIALFSGPCVSTLRSSISQILSRFFITMASTTLWLPQPNFGSL